jgi:uncharacterized protein (TIGR02246 family)
MNPESEIRALLDKAVKATRAKDVDALMRHYAPDVLAFDVIDPLQYTGADALRQQAAAWFSSFDGAIHYELAAVSVAAAGDIAFCHSLSHVVGSRTDGGKLDMWWRTTYGLRRTNNAWMITHVHNSVPFDPGSGRASVGLEP